MKKVYYELIMTAKSPLRIGGGGSEVTDNDLIMDGRGIPFIPGSSLAGVLRSMLTDSKEQSDIFGDVEIATENTEALAYSSRVLISDGVLAKDFNKKNLLISRRDGVGLDDWGMTIKGAKYDFQVAEVKDTFRSVIECNFDTETQLDIFDNLMAQVSNDGLLLGARTSRGYGRMACQIRRREFQMPDAIEEWLEFRVNAEDAFTTGNVKKIEPVVKNNTTCRISLKLRLKGSLIIRVKEANAVVKEDGTNPDDVTIKNHEGNPVIPGTAWAGAFRHHMLHLGRELSMEKIDETSINRLFGKGKSGSDSTKSVLLFTESVIWGSESITTMRNSVDRFTASPINAGLFTNEACYGGETELEISFRKNSLSSEEKQLMAACIIDLHLGLLSVGGSAGIGKGILEIVSITVDGVDKTKELEDYSLGL